MIGTKLADRYEIIDELGRGGMGVVYRALDPLLERDVAIKLVPPTLLTEDGEQRFLREAQIVAKMDHPAIVPVYDIGRHEGSLFFVMPVMRGTNLRSALRERSLTLDDVVEIGVQVAEALEYSHARGIVHRDIKPENIMVASDDAEGRRVRIMDFGLAQASYESQLTRLTKAGTLIGTVAYLSPEQVRGAEVDGRSDVYSLGVVLYECLLGEPPFVGEIQAILYRIAHEAPQPPSVLGAHVDQEIEAIAMQCIAKDPEQRPARPRDVADALARYRLGLSEDERSRPVRTATLRLTRPGVAPRPATPMVGRDRELEELQWRLNAAVGGECQFAVVSGGAGIGKTRLLEEIERLARARRIRVLHGRFFERGRAFPYQGFCEVIQDYFVAREASVSSFGIPDFSDLAPELVELFPVLAEIGEMRSVATTEGRRIAPPEVPLVEDPTAVFELLARAIARIGGGRPLVLLLEDLHRAEVSLDALQYVVRRLGPTPTLIAATYRSDEVDRRHPLFKVLGGFAGDRRFVEVTLGPLASLDHRALVEAVIGGPKLTDSLATRLYEATEGNPFFTKELVRALVDSGGIAEDEAGTLSFSSELGITSDDLPVTIQQAVERRIEGLPDDLREVLSVASVLGRSFELPDLETLAEGRWDVEEAVDRLVRQGLLEEERESRGDRLAFASGVVRDVLYAGISRRRRRSLHRRYAEHLERRYSGRLERVYGQLLHHYSNGDVPDMAVEYGLHAARRSLDAFSAEEAIRAVRIVLEFLEDEWNGDRALEGEARVLLAAAYRQQGNTDASLREAERAIRTLEETGRRDRAAAALLLAAETAWGGRRVEDAKQWLDRGIDVARAAGATAELTRLLALGATVSNLRGEYETAKLYLEEAERLAPAPDEGKDEVPRGGRLVVALRGALRAAEPAEIKLTAEEEVLANVFERLIVTDAQGSLLPSLCQRWERLDDGKAFRLHLRRYVTFSDGHPMTAHDVKASFVRACRVAGDSLPAAIAAIRGAALAVGMGSGHGTEGREPLEGIVVRSDHLLEIQLSEPLPVYPSLLTDLSTAIARVVEEGDTTRIVGTGPFRVVSRQEHRALLEQNTSYWRGTPARIDEIEFLSLGNPTEIADRFRAGEIDVARGLLPEDLERMLRDPRLRAGFVETAQKNVCTLVFNCSGPAARSGALRRALAGVTRTRDLVWSTLGRFAQPATGLIPPGTIGHDPGRKRRTLSVEQAKTLLDLEGVTTPVELRIAVNPGFKGRYSRLLQALFDVWAEVGVSVRMLPEERSGYDRAWVETEDIDALIESWSADYDDPDNFTYGLFRSGTGTFHRYFSSAETDELADEARGEAQAAIREARYRKFENILIDSAVVIPLFHEVTYRIAGPRVRNLKLQSSPPFVNYTEVAKVASAAPAMITRRGGGGLLRVPTGPDAVMTSLDPVRISTDQQAEIVTNVFETLTRVIEGARVVPWLAAELATEEGGRLLRFRLRDDIRFHDGRRLTARDVRYTFERLLQERDGKSAGLLLPVRGARALAEGYAGDLEGFRIKSATEFTLELDDPVSFFPVLLTDPCAAIVPEGCDRFDRSWRDGCAGTGPFRVMKFERDRQVELERSPNYWRAGLPNAEALVFELGVPYQEILSEFRHGRFSLASGLLAADADTLRHDSGFGSTFCETPAMSTAFLAFNTKRGPLADPATRQRLVRSLDVPGLVRGALGRFATPAHGVIPPGLVGYDPARRPTAPLVERFDGEFELRMMASPAFLGRMYALTERIVGTFGRLSARVSVFSDSTTSTGETISPENVDLLLASWGADYPDADSFARGLLHSKEGLLGPFCGGPELDRLAYEGRTTTDPAARNAIYREIEQIVARDALLLPLFHPQKYRFARPEVEGLALNPLSYPVVAYEHLWIRR